MHSAVAEVIVVIGCVALFMVAGMCGIMKLMTVILSTRHARARSISCPLEAGKHCAEKHRNQDYSGHRVRYSGIEGSRSRNRISGRTISLESMLPEYFRDQVLAVCRARILELAPGLDDDSAMNLNLSSERLSLNPLESTDLDLCLEMFTDPAVVKYADGLMSESAIKREMSNWTKRGGNGRIGVWCISDRMSGEKYGSVALLPIPIEEDDTDFNLVVPGKMPDGDIEIGYFLKRSAWGHGYATESCRRVLQFAFQEASLLEVVATFEEENGASRNVLEKAGFADRGTMRCYGEEGPNYRITRDEWKTITNNQ
jgi:ribosomal-protein-alanine N-acetyltransferase